MVLEDLAEACAKCGLEVKPFEAHVHRDGSVMWLYRCGCGNIWRAKKLPDLRIRITGNRLSLREAQGLDEPGR